METGFPLAGTALRMNWNISHIRELAPRALGVRLRESSAFHLCEVS